MKDTLSRLLAILAMLVGIGTLVAAYMLWTMIGDNKTAFTDMLQGYDQRIAALEEWRAEEMKKDGKPEDTRALMPEGYTGTLSAINAPASELVEFRDSDIGLVMKVPYNPAWGNRLYRVAPYDIQHFPDSDPEGRKELVQFGTSFVFEGGGWARAYSLLAGPQRSIEDEKAYIQDANDGFLGDKPIETVEVNGKTALVYYTEGLCSDVNVTVIGQWLNYTLTPTCGDSDEIREELLNVVGTMEFIDYENLL